MDQIDKYLNGELNAKELQAFEERLQTDTAFAEEVRLRGDMNSYLINKDKKAAFKDQLDEIGDDFFKEESEAKIKPINRSSGNLSRWLKVVAATAAVAVIVYLLAPGPDLYKEFAQHQPIQLTEKSSDQAELITAIENNFNSGNYVEALESADLLLAQQSDDLQVQVVKSICLIESNQTQDARELLQPIAEGSSAFKAEAQWYLALSWLKEKNKEQTKNALERIDNAYPFFYRKAQQLLKKL